MAAASEKIIVVCCKCSTTIEATPLKDGSEPQPRGWHRLAGALWCPKCWADNFALRSIVLPVASVIEGYASGESGEWGQEACAAGWKAFRTALRVSSRQAAQYANLAISECFAADQEPLLPTKRKRKRQEEEGEEEIDGVKLPKLEYPDSRPKGRQRFSELDSQSLGSVHQKAQAKYREQRWDLRVTCRKSLASFRSDLPVPVPAKDARLEVSHKHQQTVAEGERQPGRGEPFLRLRLAGHQFTLRLRSGAGNKRGEFSFWRKIAALEKIECGEALQGEVKLFERKMGEANGRNGAQNRAAPGAPAYGTRVFASIACWLPKDKGEREQVTIRVVTGPDRLWTIFVGDSAEPINVNEEQARRWVIVRRTRLHALSEDHRFERRSRLRGCPVQPSDLAGPRQRISDTYDRLLKDWSHKAARILANLAKRRRACRVVYNDSDKRWCPKFPWFMVWTMFQNNLNEFGIEGVHETTSGDGAG